MARGAAARRYAKALFQLAREDGHVAEIRADLDRMAALLADNSELRDVLLRPLHPVAERRQVLAALADSEQARPILKNFYAFLVSQRRLIDFAGIRDEYGRLADEESGLMKARVRSAVALRDDQLERLRQALAARSGRQIEFEVEIDDTLLGGVVAQIGDLVFDGSLRTQLHQLRAGLVES